MTPWYLFALAAASVIAGLAMGGTFSGSVLILGGGLLLFVAWLWLTWRLSRNR